MLLRVETGGCRPPIKGWHGNEACVRKGIKGLLVLDVMLGVLLAICVTVRIKQYRESQNETETVFTSAVADIRKIALTFDDGPHPYYTEQLLDGLKERNVAVTFFVTGEHAKKYPELILRMQQEGHLIGNHTYSHMQLRANNRETFRQELVATNDVIQEITGEPAIYVRPPYGTWDKTFETELNMFPVLWSIDPMDWCSHNVSCIVSSIVGKVEEGDIILMHDEYDTTVTAALKVVDQLQEKGFTFVTVDEILFD